jgi:hypothetical protein
MKMRNILIVGALVAVGYVLWKKNKDNAITTTTANTTEA